MDPEALDQAAIAFSQSNQIPTPTVQKPRNLPECRCEARIWGTGSGKDQCKRAVVTNGLCKEHAAKAAEGETPCIFRDGRCIGLFFGRISVGQEGEEQLPPYKADGEWRIEWKDPEVRKRVQEQGLPVWDWKAVRKANSKRSTKQKTTQKTAQTLQAAIETDTHTTVQTTIPATLDIQKKTRAPSKYNLYMKNEIPNIKAQNPGISHKDAFAMAARNWKTHSLHTLPEIASVASTTSSHQESGISTQSNLEVSTAVLQIENLVNPVNQLPTPEPEPEPQSDPKPEPEPEPEPEPKPEPEPEPESDDEEVECQMRDYQGISYCTNIETLEILCNDQEHPLFGEVIGNWKDGIPVML
jgi:hypothetical protein